MSQVSVNPGRKIVAPFVVLMKIHSAHCGHHLTEIAMKIRLKLLATLFTAMVAVVPFQRNVHAEDDKRSAAARPAPASKPNSSGYVAANGVNYHYQIHGDG